MVFVITALLVLTPYQAVFEWIKLPAAWCIIKNSLLLTCCMDMVVNTMTGQVAAI